jgi:hypothetical protein
MQRISKVIVIFCALLTFQIASFSISEAAINTCAQGGICVIGDTGPGGGKVFFVKSVGAFSKSRVVESGMCPGFMCHFTTYTVALTSDQQAALPFDYLEAAPTENAAREWATTGLVTGSTSELIGTGAANTYKIMNTFLPPTYSTANNAAYIAQAYTNAGKSDWFLPSYEELLLIVLLDLESTSGGPSIGNHPNGYWSSSSVDPTTARYSASNQLSGAVSRGVGILTVSIRSFSITDIGTASIVVADDAAARLRAAEEAAARIKNARIKLQQILETKAPVTEQNLIDADVPLKNPKSMIAAYNELLNFQKLQISPLPTLERSQKISSVIMKYVTIEEITGDNPQIVSARDLVTYGLLDAGTPQKTRIVSSLEAQPLASRDTIEKVDIYIAAEVKVENDRRARIAQRLTRHS